MMQFSCSYVLHLHMNRADRNYYTKKEKGDNWTEQVTTVYSVRVTYSLFISINSSKDIKYAVRPVYQNNKSTARSILHIWSCCYTEHQFSCRHKAIYWATTKIRVTLAILRRSNMFNTLVFSTKEKVGNQIVSLVTDVNLLKDHQTCDRRQINSV